ncbi:MAG: undecaprenyldiphospho-muramoylpentapeptide beta-N-acetylglucosaminyltransferase [Alphaproteobacteria bacterium]|nr:undecaprenyldiphospho-muramoylpentapeptide beta-N-acetylglucosaminyltransferase [Alphaproteobacteria bacterium]
MAEQPCIMLAAGGTGGHIFPAEALARTLRARGARVVLVTDRRGGKFSDDLNVQTYRISADTLRKGLLSKFRSVFSMGIGLLQAQHIIRRVRPAAVVGFGGYPSVPTIYAASQLGVPIVLHEQNAVLGRANRTLMGKARLVATSFPQVAGLKHSGGARMVQTGNPVRPAFAALREAPYPAVSEDGTLNIFVMGGSQGAKIFSHVVPQALALLPEPLRRRIIVAQQCRAEDLETAKTAFAAVGVDAQLSTFFRDVPERLAACHLAICRAGASTIAELTATGRPAILVPYPFGHADEQTANAEAVAEAGAAWLIPQSAFTPEALAVRLEALLTLPASLTKTAAAARAWGTVDAAEHLANCVLETAGMNAAGDIHKPVQSVNDGHAVAANMREKAA